MFQIGDNIVIKKDVFDRSFGLGETGTVTDIVTNETVHVRLSDGTSTALSIVNLMFFFTQEDRSTYIGEGCV